MRNVTFNVDERTLALARARAEKQNRSLNEVFREWLADYAQADTKVLKFRELMKKLEHVQLDGPFTREEMNRRR